MKRLWKKTPTPLRRSRSVPLSQFYFYLNSFHSSPPPSLPPSPLYTHLVLRQAVVMGISRQANSVACHCAEGGLGGGIRVQLGMLWAQQLSNHSRPSPTPLCQLWLNTADLFWKKRKKKKKNLSDPHSPCSSLPSRLGHPMKTQRRASKKLIYWHLVAEN